MPSSISKIQFIVGLLALFCFSIISAQAGPTWTPRYVGTTVNGQTVPYGYYEYLPTSYNSGSPLSTYPVVIFLHGSGEYGNGSSSGSPNLSAVLGAGVPHDINSNISPLAQTGGEFDSNNVIVLCPQHNDPSPWVPSTQVRPFLNFALAAYPKIDKRRIWMTGLSYGSTGVTEMMDSAYDPSPDDVAAVVACAWRGDVFPAPSNAIGKLVPFWGLTSQGDFWQSGISGGMANAGNNLAAAISGNNSLTDVNSLWNSLSNTSTTVYTGNFNGTSTWNWSTGVDATTGVSPKMTVFTGSDHNSWDRTYTNTNTWNWLFQQQKPDVSISTPSSSSTISTHGTSISFAGSATDKNGTSLTGSSLQWISSQDGVLGTGASISTSSLSYGYHYIKLQATDNSYRDNKAYVNVTVPYTSAFTSYFDFGPTGVGTSGWNDVTQNAGTVFPVPSVITNAVNSSGTHVGINLALNPGFFAVYNNGVASSALYPLAAQEGNFNQPSTDYSGNPLPNPQLLISGLNPSQTYTFTFFCSTTAYENGPTNYTIGSTTVSVNPINNTSNTASITATPNAAGQVSITMSKGTGAYFIWLNVLTISSAGTSGAPAFTDGPPPTTGTNGTSYSFTYTASGSPSPTFSVSAGSLPTGLSLSSGGAISGTPSATGVFSGTVTATNSNGSANQNFSITIQQAPAITNGPPPSPATVSTAYSFTYTTTGYPTPTFTVSAGSLPTGLSLSSGGALSGTPTTTGTYSGTVRASNGVGAAATQNFSITIQNASSAPTITNGPATSTATVGTAYSFSYTFTGSPTPTFTVSAGSLPSGLSLSSGGVLSGTPTTTGTYSGTVQASNGVGTAATQNFSIVVSASSSGSVVAAINCGSTSSYTASDGTVYSADTYYSGGSPYQTWDTISSPDPTLFNLYRYANGSGFSYAVPLANGNYTVTLRFCETNHGDTVGMRVGNYSLQGTTVLSSFDILATAGAYDTPVDETFSVTVTSGTLNVGVGIVTGSPRIDAIVVRSANPTVVAAVNCGSTSSYTASDGTVYSADTYYSGGSPYQTWDTISSPDPNLFNFYRYCNGSNFSYAIPLANGSYTVTLRFCETNHGDTVGMRVGNYSLQGTTVLSNFDILATAGAYDTPIDETFSVTVTSGTLNIGVGIVTGSPRLDAIVVESP